MSDGGEKVSTGKKQIVIVKDGPYLVRGGLPSGA